MSISSVQWLNTMNKRLIQKTNRFVRVSKMLVPMIIMNDITFADFGTVYTPESKSNKRKSGKRKWFSMTTATALSSIGLDGFTSKAATMITNKSYIYIQKCSQKSGESTGE
jgi:hypothetical protein